MKNVIALVLCGALLASPARADLLADIQAATDAFKQGDLTTAEVLLSEAIDSGKLDDDKHLLAKVLAWRCTVRIKAEQYEAAAGDCERTIELDPSYSSAHLNLGSIHVLKMEYEAAIAEFSLALQHGKLPEKDIAMAYSNRGWAYFFQQDYQSALKDFDSALAEDPRYEAALNGRASSYVGIGELDRAMADVEAALRAYPASPQPIINRGLVRMYRGQLDDAVADFDKFIEVAPESPSGYFNRALVMFIKSDWNAAIADLDRLLLVHDDVPFALYLRGLARRKLGQGDLAQQDFDRARFIDPTAESAVENVLSKLRPQ
jgi:tetratricopeptide (TPR) repeat protein